MEILSKKYKTVAGFEWTVSAPDYQCYLNAARFGHSKKWVKRQTGVYATATDLKLCDPGECMVLAMREIFPRHVLDMNRWAENISISFVNNLETGILGAAGCGKSRVIAALALLWWSPAPKTSTLFMASTSKDGLKRRVWGYMAEMFDYLKKKGYPGVHNRQMTAILNESDAKEGVSADSVRSGIFGIAVESGNDTEVSGRIGGAHQSTVEGADNFGEGSVVMIADECNAMAGAGAWYKAVSNMIAGADLFRMVSMANPWSGAASGAVGSRCTPKDGGWSSIDIDSTYEWESTKGAHVIRLDAYDSPGVKDDPERYSYLPTEETIAEILKQSDGNMKDPRFLCMARAMVSDGISYDTVLPRVLQERYKVLDDVEFLPGGELFNVMGIDPAFTQGGDKCAAVVGQVGYFPGMRLGIRVAELRFLEIDGTSKRPVSYQLEAQVNQMRTEYDIPMENVFIDSTGTQALDDVIEEQAREYGINRISFSFRATDDPVSEQDPTPSNQRFGSIRGQMWYKAREFARCGQLKNLPPEAAEEFASRIVLPRKLIEIESKLDYKLRNGGKSPDAGDGVALMLFGAFMLGVMPGATYQNPSGGITIPQPEDREVWSPDTADLDFSDESI